MTPWSPEEIATLQRLITKEGKSFGECAKILNRSRNAVAGKAYNLQLKAPDAKPMLTRVAAKPRLPSNARHAKPDAPLYVASSLPTLLHNPDPQLAIPIINNGQCKWPIGDPQHPTFRFCTNQRANDHQPYCATHNAKAFIKPNVPATKLKTGFP